MNIIDIITAVFLFIYGIYLILGMIFDLKSDRSATLIAGILTAAFGIAECIQYLL